ncbi:hypothetical protein ACFLYO_08640, partial [Chloroflexota bacterium]
MPQRKHSTVKQLKPRQSHRIILPISRSTYQEVVADPMLYRGWVEGALRNFPRLFPGGFSEGFTLHDQYQSKKMNGEIVRRVRQKRADEQGQRQVYTVTPSYLMPYMTGYTDEVADALFLVSFGVPCWALTMVFGHNDMYWQRHIERLGRYDIVGTTVQHAERLPQDLLADEKHTRWQGVKAYIAMTVGGGCVLGVSMALAASADALTEAYGYFKAETRRLQEDYQPTTVNTDGWKGTHAAWLTLFPAIVILRCFLHAFLNIRSCCKRLDYFPAIQDMVWEIYYATTPVEFYHRVGDLFHWTQQSLSGSRFAKPRQAIEKLCARTGDFLLTFDHSDAYRTSNAIDRLMVPLDRWLSAMFMFHGHLMTAEFRVRAWALIHNFRPYCPRSEAAKEFISPAHKL